MKEVGIINRGVAKLVSEQGHGDALMVVDAGSAIPKDIEVVDLSLRENAPIVIDVLAELKKYHSVEKMILAQQTKTTNPTLFSNISNAWGDDMDLELIDLQN